MLTTVSIIQFRNNKGKAFAAMGLLPRKLKKAEGLQFFKMMGSGKGNAFSLMPDFSRYCMLATWKDKEDAEDFFTRNKSLLQYTDLAAGIAHVFLEPLSAKGTWNGQQPFTHQNQKPDTSEPVAVLTRASLNWTRLPSFWRNARISTNELPQKGLFYSIGIGEVPYVEQATFSIWESATLMMDYVTAPAHLQAIKLRHQERWYREELFARFKILEVSCSKEELFPELASLQSFISRPV